MRYPHLLRKYLCYAGLFCCDATSPALAQVGTLNNQPNGIPTAYVVARPAAIMTAPAMVAAKLIYYKHNLELTCNTHNGAEINAVNPHISALSGRLSCYHTK